MRPAVPVVGREAEFAALTAALRDEASERALVLIGEPGIGKTTIWEVGVEAARTRAVLVLCARPAAAETGFSFAGLADLLETVGPEVLAPLPEPQRHALEVALLRAEPGPVPPGPRAVATGILGVLRGLSARGPVLVAVDDTQWLDAASAQALTFAARRLNGEPVRFLLSRRSKERARLEEAFPAHEVVRLNLCGLSLGAVGSLLADRLDVHPNRRVLRQIYEASGGNPLFALEIGRLLIEQGLPEAGEELPVPKAVADLVGVRVARLSHGVRRVLLAVALDAGLDRAQVCSLASAAAVEDAFASGVLVFEGERMRAAHPLLATAVRGSASATEQHALHRELAEITADAERAARHLALGTSQPDAQIATEVALAAARAAARGAAEDTAELSAHAFRLTPPQDAARPERLFVLAERLVVLGESRHADELLTAELPTLPSGEARAIAHLLLSGTDWSLGHLDQRGAHLVQALAEAPAGSVVHARAAGSLARFLLVGPVERIAEAEALAAQAVAVTRGTNATVEREVLQTLAQARVLRGRPIDDLWERFVAVSPDAFDLQRGVERLVAERLAVRGNVRQARSMFHRLLALAEERDETWSSVWLMFQLCELELRAGDWDAAAELQQGIAAYPGEPLIDEPARDRCRALLAAGLGRAAEAERWAARAIATCERRGLRWDWLEALRARGLAALLAHEPGRAVESLGAVWEHTQREGVEEPGEFPVAPDLVEALLELGRLDDARCVSARLRVLAEAQAHPWGLATASRCEALLALAQHHDRAALEHLSAAAVTYRELDLCFDYARTLLAAGRAARRQRMWGATGDLLRQAVAGFEVIGSTGWADEARGELARIGGRRHAAGDGLSATEQRVVELAADGLANKEIAGRLAISVHTVERHLTHAYRKLGVQGRAQLASRLTRTD